MQNLKVEAGNGLSALASENFIVTKKKIALLVRPHVVTRTARWILVLNDFVSWSSSLQRN